MNKDKVSFCEKDKQDNSYVKKRQKQYKTASCIKKSALLAIIVPVVVLVWSFIIFIVKIFFDTVAGML